VLIVVRTKVLLVGENHRFYFKVLDVRVDNGSVADMQVAHGKAGPRPQSIGTSIPR
jgi:hypothetical protein